MKTLSEALLGRPADAAETALQDSQLARMEAWVMRHPLVWQGEATAETARLLAIDPRGDLR